MRETMLYFGMTLGYLSPPAKKESAPRIATTPPSERDESQRGRERDHEMSRGFLTPWHLFY